MAEQIPNLIEQQAKAAADWLRSIEGRAAVAGSLEKARQLAEQFRKAEQIDPRIWEMEVR